MDGNRSDRSRQVFIRKSFVWPPASGTPDKSGIILMGLRTAAPICDGGEIVLVSAETSVRYYNSTPDIIKRAGRVRKAMAYQQLQNSSAGKNIEGILPMI